MNVPTIATGGAPLPGRLPLSVCIGWGLGSVGMMILLNVTNSLILKYVVDYLGIGAALAGALIAATRIFDAVIDPGMGMLSDRTRSRWGRRRPYLLAGAVLCALSPVVLFALPLAVTAVPMAAMVFFGLVVFSLSHTVFNVPYMAMPVEMTTDRQERTRLFAFRVFGTAVGALIGGAAAPWLVTEFGEDANAFATMSYVMAGGILGTCLASFAMTARAPTLGVAETAERPGFGELKLMLGNRPFVLLLVAKVFIVGGTTAGASAMAFFVTDVLRQPLGQLGLIAGLSTAGMILSQPLWVRIAARHGKRGSFLVAAAAYTGLVLTWLFAGPDESIVIVGMRAFVLGLAGGGVLLNSQSMLPDVLEHEVALTGVRHEGSMTGVYTTIERGSSALGVALAGAVLGAGGYVGGTLAGPEAVRAIYACVAILPGLMMAASMIVLWRYDLPG